ncbi:MAG TPA: GPW/gp25 family protein [Longimicrobiales bacterium]|nr:GPW/gp25 family protein [Longimicrobiales bacterium]
MATDKAFLGRGWSFPPDFSRAGKRVHMVSEEEEIRQALTILFGTAPGERVMHPTFGCGLKALVFEGMTPGTVAEIKTMIERAVLFHEPRILLHAVEVAVLDEFGGELAITLEYTIRSTNTRTNMVYPFYVLEGTNVDVGRGRA